MPIRVLVAADHRVLRQGLRTFLGIDPDITVVGEAANGAEAVRLAHDLLPDVVLMDLGLRILDGVAATESIRHGLPETEVIALVSTEEETILGAAMRAGSLSYLLKSSMAVDLRRGVKAAAMGRVQAPPHIIPGLLREAGNPALTESLAVRETDVLRLLASGHSTGEIAEMLDLSEEHIVELVACLMGKLGAIGRTHAVLAAVNAGIVPQELLESR